jgi:hypothetical protein
VSKGCNRDWGDDLSCFCCQLIGDIGKTAPGGGEKDSRFTCVYDVCASDSETRRENYCVFRLTPRTATLPRICM